MCEWRGSELEYDESDLRMGTYGCMYIDCPVCGKDNMLEENEHSITLTVDNIEFPVHFHHVSEATGAKNACTNEEIKKCIKKAVDYFRKNKDEFCYFTAFGNLHVSVHRFSGDENYYVLVASDYFDTYVPFEEEDYED